MLPDFTNAAPKVHPATRGVEPDDPYNLHGVEVDGDPEIMLRMVVEEYARTGFGLEELLDMSRQPFYQGLHGLWQRYGEAELRRRLIDILSRCGVFRVAVRETTRISEQLVQLSFNRVANGPREEPGSHDHARPAGPRLNDDERTHHA